jgi:predicted transposase/invertase (TIGR01784 family)
MLAPLDNETIFKKAFTDIDVFQQFVKDLFDIDIVVNKIETEKKFVPPMANIDIELDIYAETADHRFVIEIQKIDYDYNFNRFLGYFISLLIEQQKRGAKYEIPQTVLGVVVLTRPYKINQITGEPIHESVMSIDFDPRNLQDKRIKLWNHKLLFLNPNPKYKSDETPKNYQDWLDLFYSSVNDNINYKLNLNNKGIAKTIQLIEYEKLDPKTIAEMKKSEAKKAMISIVENEGISEGRNLEKVGIAKEMIIENFPKEQIAKITKLSIETIEQLINELNKK